MTSLDLEHFAKAVAEIGFIAGVVGGIFGLACARVLDDLTDMFLAWEERRMRIHQARMRQQHGPLLLPGSTRLGRVLIRRALRARVSAQGDLARACERQGNVRG